MDAKVFELQDDGLALSLVAGRYAASGLRDSMLKDGVALFKQLGNDALLWSWDSESSVGHRLLTAPVRQKGRRWTHQALGRYTHELQTALLPGWDLRATLEFSGGVDVWSVGITLPGDRFVVLKQCGAAWISADRQLAIAAPQPLGLAMPGPVLARLASTGVELTGLGVRSTGPLALPPGAQLELYLGDGEPTVHLGTLPPNGTMGIQLKVEDMESPRVEVRAPSLLFGDQPLASDAANVTILTSFTQLRSGADCATVLPAETVADLILSGETLYPKHLVLELGHKVVGDPRAWQIINARREDAAVGLGHRYHLSSPWSLPPGAPRLGEIVVRCQGKTVGTLQLPPEPLRARWKHPKRSGLEAMPALAAKCDDVEPECAPGASFAVLPDGRLRYVNGQVGELHDHAFRPLLPLLGDRDAFARLVAWTGRLEAWLPGGSVAILDQHEVDFDFLRGELSKAARSGTGLRLGRAGSDWRGVLSPGHFDPIVLPPCPPVEGVFHLPLPPRERPLNALVWHRGLRLPARLVRLDTHAAEENDPEIRPQAALYVDGLPIDVGDAPELSPFLPVRAWQHEIGGVAALRLQDGPDEMVLHAGLPGPVPWVGPPGALAVHWPGLGFFHDCEPPAGSDGRFAWNGLILRADGQRLRFDGWLLGDTVLARPAWGPFGSWGLVLGEGSQADMGEREVTAANLSEQPPGVAALCRAFFNRVGGRSETVVVDGATWSVRPDPDHPRKPPTRCKVVPPRAVAPTPQTPTTVAVAIWVERP